MSEKNKFVNGITSYLETHCFICMEIATQVENKFSVAGKRELSQGIGGIFELAEELTDEFEELHINEEWVEKDYFEEIMNFLVKKGMFTTS